VATIGRNPRLTSDEGREALEEFLGLAVPTIADDNLIREAYPLVQSYGCAFYDALYLALAQRLGISFITADHKLYERIRWLPSALWLGDYT
jgi:predicted nucleic acid-binding protein